MMTFRDFSYAVYTAPGVAEECLRLQDEYGVDVNVLLFCAYAAVVAKVALTADDLTAIDAEVAALRDGVIVPLRTCRRTLKQGVAVLPGVQRDAAEQLRRQVKDIELAAEYLEQDRLVEWLTKSGRVGPRESSVAPKVNIDLLLSRQRYGGPYPERLEHAALTCA